MPVHTKKNVKKRTYKRNVRKQLSRGSASVSLFIVLIMVLLIFLGSLFITKRDLSATPESSGTPIDKLTSAQKAVGGGLIQFSMTPYPTSFGNANCQLITNDIMILVDNSGSMRGNKLAEAKAAANLFVQLLAINPENRIGLVVFNKTSSIRSDLTNNYPALTQQINAIGEGSNTCIQCGVLDGNTVIAASSRTNVKRSIVLLSDGKANHVNGVQSTTAKEEALAEIRRGFTTSKISYYTIAFGKDADTNFMRQAAVETDGVQFTSADEKQLKDSFAAAANAICADQ